MILTETIERARFSFHFYQNGLVELILHENSLIDLEDSKEQEKILNEFNPDNGKRILVITGIGTSVSKEAREYANQNPLDAKAMAVISRSLPQKIIVNFMITIYRKLKPSYPVKMFLKKEEAVNWLLNHG